jgi:hypothetical protein
MNCAAPSHARQNAHFIFNTSDGHRIHIQRLSFRGRLFQTDFDIRYLARECQQDSHKVVAIETAFLHILRHTVYLDDFSAAMLRNQQTIGVVVSVIAWTIDRLPIVAVTNSETLE